MTYLTSKIRGFTVGMAAAGSLVAAVTADAAVYRGRWDPAYGAALPELGWKGVAEFEIAPDCLAGIVDDGWVSNLVGACKNKLSINSAAVTLYDLDATNGKLPDVTLSYSSASLKNGGNIPFTLRMYVDVIDGQQSEIRAVEGGFWFPENVTASFAVASGYKGALYWLGFSGDQPNLENSTQAEARLASCSYKWASLECSVNNNDPSKGGVAAAMTITPVPEPEAYMLGLASLAVIGVWNRRRRHDAA
jgi:hypothetical protein